jgi:LuxR family maltose regulon positive regulatory protein
MRDVLDALARGLTVRETARELRLGQTAVRGHRGRIYRRLRAADRHDALTKARALGLLP